MARLTNRERNLIKEARNAPSWPTWDETDAIILAARQARAKLIARWVRQGLAPLAGAAATARSVTGRAILPLRRDLLRRRTVNELNRLEDHVLADIGIAREQIEPIVADLALAALPPRKPSVGTISRFRSWRRRRAAVRELEALDDRLLDDIGLQRGNIRKAVEQAAIEHANDWDSVVRMLRNWETSRQSARKAPGSGPEAAANRDPGAKKFNREDSAAAEVRAQRHQAA